MPRARRARDRRSRARKGKRRDTPFPLILEIEVPLTDAIHYADALRLIGHGLTAHDETGGEAIATLAGQMNERLDVVKKIWNRMLDERRRERKAS
jgi:stalled ribosome rescue protein Dom34